MTQHDDLDMLAAEYALGTLDADTRADVARRRQQEPELEALIQAWEARLEPSVVVERVRAHRDLPAPRRRGVQLR